MKKFTHALIACKAVERLQKVALSDQNKPFADFLLEWFAAHKDGVIRGAWYPDEVIGDKSTSHVLKHTPNGKGALGVSAGNPVPPASGESEAFSAEAPGRRQGAFRSLPTPSLQYAIGRASPLYNQPYAVNPNNNLPERCEALSHAVIDNLRIREREPKGSPLTPTDNHVALILFMLSHYVADAHMPMHCDARDDEFLGFNLHSATEEAWEREVVRYYKIDRPNQRFIYNEQGYPFLVMSEGYSDSILAAVTDELERREFRVGYGQDNENVREYILAVTQFSYLTSYAWLPAGLTLDAFDRPNLQTPHGLTFREMSIAALADTIDAVSRVWLHDLRRFCWWKEKREA